MALCSHMPGLTGRALGLVLIFLTAIIWVAASFVSQLLVTNQEGRTAFNVPPFLLTYLSTSIFTVFLPLVQLKSLLQETWLLRRSFKYKPLQDDEEAAPMHPAAAAAAAVEAAAEADGDSPGCQAGGGGLTADLEAAEAAAAADAASKAARASRAAHKEALTAAAQCFLLWFVAQFLFNQSLQLTSVTSNTILSSTSSLFTFALSMVFLREPYSLAKLASIAACIGGTLLVTLSDDSSSGSSTSSNVRGSSLAAAMGNVTAPAAAVTAAPTPGSSGGSSGGPSHSVWGDMLCLVSAAFYACYTIVLRKALPDEEEANVALFFGYVGLLCSVVFAPVVALLGGIGALHLQAIPPKAYLIILVQGILNYCLSDYLWAHAVLLLGPTIATLGLSVQIPVAAVVEAIIGHPKWLSSGAAMAMTLSGTALIMAGFVAGNLAGGGHVYGSHHREDIDDVDRLQQCRSPGGLADDSFTDHCRSPAAGARLNGTHDHHNGVFRSSPVGSDSSSDEGDMPQSPLLHTTKQQSQQQQQRHVFSNGSSMPVSTHARIVPQSEGQSHLDGGSSPWQRDGSPSRQQQPAADYADLSSGRSPRAAARGVQQLLPTSLQQQQESQQQQQQQGTEGQLRRQQPSQQWESIELSSSPFGSESKIEHGLPSVLTGLRPKDQLPQQRSNLEPPASDTVAEQAAAAQSAAAAVPGLQAPPPGSAAAEGTPPQQAAAAAGDGSSGSLLGQQGQQAQPQHDQP